MGDNNREIVIRLSAENLTNEEFEKVRKGIAGIRASSEEAEPRTKGFGESIREAADKSDFANMSFGKMAGGMVAGLLTVDALKAGFQRLAQFIGDSIQEAAEAESVQARLTAALRAQGLAVPDVADNYAELADEFSNLGTFSDDALTEIQALMTEIGVSPSRMRPAMQATIDLAAAKRIDLEQAATAVGKAVVGEARALNQLVPQLNEARVQGGDVAEVFRAVEASVGGSAQAQLETYAGRIAQASNAWADFKEAVGEVILNDPVVRSALEGMTASMKGVGDEAEGRKGDLLDWWMALAGVQLTPEMQIGLGLLRAHLNLARDIDAQLRGMRANAKAPIITPPEIGPVKDAQEIIAQALKDGAAKIEQDKVAKAAADEWARAVRQLTDELSGAKLQGEVRKLEQATRNLTAEQRQQPDILKRIGASAEQLRVKGAELSPELLLLAIRSGEFGKNVLTVTVPAVDRLGERIAIVTPQIANFGYFPGLELGVSSISSLGMQIDAVPPKVEDVEIEIDDLARALADLAEVSGGSFGGIVQGLSTVVASLSAVDKGMKSFEAGRQAFSGGDTIAGIAGMASGIMGIASAAIAAGQAIAKMFDRNKGRDLVKDFAESFGGFDALHKKLQALGDEGERLWIRLTQGVGRNNPEQAKAAIEAINAAFGDQESKVQRLQEAMDKYGITWEELGPKARNARLNELAQALIDDFNLLMEAEIDAGIISERMANEVNDFLARAMRTGSEIPAAMRPMLEKMLEYGQLTDAAGNKLESLEGITFAETITQGFTRVIDKLDEMIERLVGGVPRAIQNTFNSIPKSIDISLNITKKITDADDGGDTTSVDVKAYATGGIAAGTQIAKLAEQGRKEIVGDEEFMANALAGALAKMRGESGSGAAAATLGGASTTNLYVAMDPASGRVRPLGEIERRTIQQWLFTGNLRVPERALTA